MFSQELIIFGVVSDYSGPIPGANVRVKGTIKSAQTDIDGKYSIKAFIGDYLEFSFPELITHEICIQKNEINIRLEKDLESSIPIEKKNWPDYTIVSAEDIKNSNNPNYYFDKDLKYNKLKIYSPYISLSENDLKFELKYNVSYSNIINQSIEFYDAYNNLVFKYFKKKYSRTWHKEIRKDTIGLNKKSK